MPNDLNVVLDSPVATGPTAAKDQATTSEIDVKLDPVCHKTPSAVVSVYRFIESQSFLGVTERELRVSS